MEATDPNFENGVHAIPIEFHPLYVRTAGHPGDEAREAPLLLYEGHVQVRVVEEISHL